MYMVRVYHGVVPFLSMFTVYCSLHVTSAPLEVVLVLVVLGSTGGLPLMTFCSCHLLKPAGAPGRPMCSRSFANPEQTIAKHCFSGTMLEAFLWAFPRVGNISPESNASRASCSANPMGIDGNFGNPSVNSGTRPGSAW